MKSPANREAVARIVRASLEAGQTVEIEGLGVFRMDARSRAYRFAAQTRPEVFVAYATEDLPEVRKLVEHLRREGCSPWLDKEKLLPGQNWPRAIEGAIEIADAFVACFSSRSVVKRGQFQSELRYALACARRRPLDDAFLIPVRLEECAVPRRIAAQTQYVDLFPNWERGAQRVVSAVKKAAVRKPIAGLA